MFSVCLRCLLFTSNNCVEPASSFSSHIDVFGERNLMVPLIFCRGWMQWESYLLKRSTKQLGREELSGMQIWNEDHELMLNAFGLIPFYWLKKGLLTAYLSFLTTDTLHGMGPRQRTNRFSIYRRQNFRVWIFMYIMYFVLSQTLVLAYYSFRPRLARKYFHSHALFWN